MDSRIDGQIGHALNEVLDPLEIEVLNTDKDELDITDTKKCSILVL